MDNTLCIVGLGAFTPVGFSATTSAAFVYARMVGVSMHPYMIDTKGESCKVAMVPALETGLVNPERIQTLITTVIEETLKILTERNTREIAIDVLLALPYPRPGLRDDMTNSLTNSVHTQSNQHYTLMLHTAAKGRGGGLIALASASKRLLSGAAEFCLIGGADSYIDPDTLLWLEISEQLHTQDNPWGFIPGEAAGACLICTRATAQRYQLPVYANVIATAVTVEPDSNSTEKVCTGRGLSEAVRQTLEHLPETTTVDQLLCDLNGQTYNTDELGFMLARLGHRFKNTNNIITPADCWGDVGAATGPLLLVLACYAGKMRYNNGPISLLYAGTGPIPAGATYPGERSAVLLNTAING